MRAVTRIGARASLFTLLVLAAACSSKTPEATPAPVPDAGPTSLLTLKPGEAVEIVVTDGRAAARLATPTGGERFVAILASAKLDSSATIFDYAVSTDVVDAPTESRALTSCSVESTTFQNKPLPNDPEPTGTAPTVGTTKSLLVSTATTDETITARVAAVSPRAVVWVDTTPAHPATLDQTFIDEFLADFDRTILPRGRALFGMESDQDGDGRISLVFSPLTNATAVAFFRSCDLLDQIGCSGGNKGEYLYLTPPANIDPPYNTPAAIKEILAHELGHLLHFNRKVLRNKLSAWPDSAYMIEGFGAFAQDVVGYQAGNLYVTQAGLEKINDFSLADVLGSRNQYDKTRDGLLRGGSYLFVRWLYDRGGGDGMKPDGAIEGRGGPALVRAVFDGKESVAATLPSFAKGTQADVAIDFYTTLALSNGEKNGGAAPANPCFAYLPVQTDPITQKPRGADLFQSFHGQSMKGAAMQSAADKKLRAGGVELLTLAASEGQAELGVTITVDGQAVPRVRVARLK